MEGHTETDSTMPPLSQIPPSSSSLLGPSITNGENPRKRVRRLDDTNCESLNMERERRSKMTHMFTQLRTTIPGVFPQATREVIINETIRYIKELEKKKERLEELKESMKLKGVQGLRIACGNNNNNNNRNCSITVTVSANVVFFGIQSLARPGLITVILKVFYKYQTEVLAANVSVDDGNLILAITALVQNGGDGNDVVENIKREIMSL
ncbi:transcription factor bHLH13-like [Cajanus cajan]|uniref:transcription factor bHLH13-like n=1 Tax=Cajanus cajan TaxID=3821 RepID=UPI0010FBB9ED|nr:transcription factor bHLH13-like [Cajanus cajan]